MSFYPLTWPLSQQFFSSAHKTINSNTTATHTHTHTRTRKHIHTNTQTHAHTHTHIHANTYTHTNTQSHTHTHTQTRKHTHTHMQTCKHTQTRKHIHTQTRKHTHTRTRKHIHKHANTYTQTNTEKFSVSRNKGSELWGVEQLFLHPYTTRGQKIVGGRRHAQAVLPLGRRPGTHRARRWVAIGVGLERHEKSQPHLHSNPGSSNP